MPRRTAMYLLTFLLVVATGVALLGTAMTIGAPWVADPRPVATEGMARAFYDAINETIRTGDGVALDAVTADDLTISGTVALLAADRAGLARYLASVHALTPQLELVVERVIAVADRAIVHLVVRGDSEARFLGSPLPGGLPFWGRVEALTVAGGRVVEYWSGAGAAVLWEPLGQTELPVPPPRLRIVTLDRLLIPSGGAFEAESREEARLLVVEAGGVAVNAAPLVVPEPLGAGDFLILPTWTPIEVRNDGQTPASLLVLAAALPENAGGFMGSSAPPVASPERGLTPIDWRAGLAQTASEGGVLAPLAGGKMSVLPAEPLRVAVGRLTLMPGVVLARYDTSGPHLLVVDQGMLGIETEEGGLWIQRGEEGHSGVPGAARLVTGEGTILDTGTTALLDNPGPDPVVVTMVAILPGDAVAGGPTATGRHEG